MIYAFLIPVIKENLNKSEIRNKARDYFTIDKGVGYLANPLFISAGFGWHSPPALIGHSEPILIIPNQLNSDKTFFGSEFACASTDVPACTITWFLVYWAVSNKKTASLILDSAAWKLRYVTWRLVRAAVSLLVQAP